MKKMKLNIQLFSIPHTYIEFEDYPSTNTPLNAANLNQMQNDIHNEIKSFTPVGVINNYAGSVAPTGWLICDGSAISRTTYADLFDVIGTTYGTGDGSTTFNLPNLKGRVPVGLNNNDTDFDALGETGGEKTHTLSIDEMPSHNHNGGILTNNTVAGGARFYFNSAGATDGTNFSNSLNISNTGGDQPHNNLQPYIVLNYIIKY